MASLSRTFRFGVLVAGVALVGGLAGAAPRAAASVPGDQPLPPYSIDNPPLAPLVVNGHPTTVTQGVYRHSAYDIEVPPHWNGDLVMWAHGYRGTGTVLTVDVPGYDLRRKVINEGYAWAASSYPDNTYDAAAGVVATHDLVGLFARTVRRPHRTYLAGVSMGGHVIGRSLEQYPFAYAGALPMCGVLGDDNLFDFFLGYNLVAQDLAGVDAYPPPADYLFNAVPRIENALGLTNLKPGGPDTTNARGKELRDITVNLTGGQRPGAAASFPLWKDFLFTFGVPNTSTVLAANPGLIATNVGTSYSPNKPVNVNRTVRRVPVAQPQDRFTTRLVSTPRIFGFPTARVLSLHGLGDMFVPISMEEIYGHEVASHGLSNLLVQRAIRSGQHCEFDATEAGTAWDDLVSWVTTGHRPAGDDLLDPAAVAAPTFGCRFSDPAAYSTGTRPLFPRCP